MKKYILYAAIISACAFSCKKDSKPANTTTPHTKMYKVNIGTSGFSEVITNSAGKLKTEGLAANSTSGIAGYLQMLYYSVYDSTGTQVRFITQTAAAANFGTITDSLAAGTYTIRMAAGMSGLVLYNNAGPKLSHEEITYNVATANGPYWQDTFAGAITLSVNSDVSQDLPLSRVVGQLEIVVLDQMPANVSKITVSIDHENLIYSLPSGLTSLTKVAAYPTAVPASAANTANYTIDYIIANTTTPMTVTVRCYDASETLLTTATIDSVSCQKNKKTILSGHLFNSGTGITATVKPWAPPINIPFAVKSEQHN